MKINLTALNRATWLTTILMVVLTIWADLNEPFKKTLTMLTGHHWVTKSVLAIVFFIMLCLFFQGSKETKQLKKEITWTVAVAILGSLTIFGFYVWHFLTV